MYCLILILSPLTGSEPGLARPESSAKPTAPWRLVNSERL